jgi:hypothetical protein
MISSSIEAIARQHGQLKKAAVKMYETVLVKADQTKNTLCKGVYEEAHAVYTKTRAQLKPGESTSMYRLDRKEPVLLRCAANQRYSLIRDRIDR